jgi:zinc D-Ala-D-Ala carboxypeptidase
VRWSGWGRGGRRGAAASCVLLMIGAAFLPGVVVGSAQVAATVSPLSVPSEPPIGTDGPVDVHDPSPLASAGTGAGQAASLPSCTLAERHAEHDPWRRWNNVVLDTEFALGPAEAPADLVDTARAGLNGGHRIRAIVVPDLRRMDRAARRAGAALVILSAYRSYAEQADTFAYWVATAGHRAALARSARPGHSEHQLGTTIDFTSPGNAAPWRRDWADSPTGAWLAAHAWRFGFVMSYPHGARERSCYAYEPWHYRYVGRPTAAAIQASSLTPREYMLRQESAATP